MRRFSPVYVFAWSALAGVLMLAFLIIRHGVPTRDELLQAARGADRIEVTLPAASGSATKVFEIRGAKNVTAMLDTVDWHDPPLSLNGMRAVRCCCDGSYHVNLYRGETLLVSLGYQHGIRFRWRNGPWATDLELTRSSSKAWPEWFKQQGFAGLEEVRLRENP